MKERIKEISAQIAAFVLIMGFAAYTYTQASAPSGLPSTYATSSTIILNVTAVSSVAATSSTCTSRVITTYSQPAQFTIGQNSSTTPNVGTDVFGIFQEASTTRAYDGGIYGCGLIQGRGWLPSTRITITEYR